MAKYIAANPPSATPSARGAAAAATPSIQTSAVTYDLQGPELAPPATPQQASTAPAQPTGPILSEVKPRVVATGSPTTLAGASEWANTSSAPDTVPPTVDRPVETTSSPVEPRRFRPPEFQFTRSHDPDTPIGDMAMACRSIAALTCVIIAIIMVLNGQGLVSIWPYAVMVFYGVAAVWGLSSMRHKIPLRQFAIEMFVLVILTLGLRVLHPDVFAIQQEADISEMTSNTPTLPATAVGRFAGAVMSYTDSLRSVLALKRPVDASAWTSMAQQIRFEDLQALYGNLTDEGKAEVFDVWRRLKEFGPDVMPLLEPYVELTGDKMTLVMPTDQREAILGDLANARLYAKSLHSRLLVYTSTTIRNVGSNSNY